MVAGIRGPGERMMRLKLAFRRREPTRQALASLGVRARNQSALHTTKSMDDVFLPPNM